MFSNRSSHKFFNKIRHQKIRNKNKFPRQKFIEKNHFHPKKNGSKYDFLQALFSKILFAKEVSSKDLEMYFLISFMDDLIEQNKPKQQAEIKNCDLDSIEDEDYIVIEPIAKQTEWQHDDLDKITYGEYDINQFEALLYQLAVKNNYIEINNESLTSCYKAFQKDNLKVALFETVKDLPDNLLECKELISFDKSLSKFKERQNHFDTLIIPVVNLEIEHYRLVVINLVNKKAEYYDSKPNFLKSYSEIAGAVVVGTRSYLNYKTEESAKPMTYTDFFYNEGKKIASFCQQAYYYMENTVKEFFPDLSLENKGLGHQWNNRDCGMHVADYVEYVLQGKDPASLGNVLPLDRRLHHRETLNKATMDMSEQEYKDYCAKKNESTNYACLSF